MRNIILGTAGHIDHGKTTLIKNLTGIDTDTLPEEAARGMTINIGFAYYTSSEGKRIGIVDVPGHEKFIKNMVAGVSGIDFIIFVIACDDGIMPQTKEHFNILKLLGVKRGIIALTKRDLVDDEQILELKASIRDEFKDSFLEDVEIIELSNKNLKSYEGLRKILEKEIKFLESEREKEKKFRLAVDRVFTVNGFGTVITGTSLTGEVQIGDALIHYPSKKKVRIKGIENHGVKVQKLGPGNRTALNLAGIEKEEIRRGDILSSDETLLESKRIDVHMTHSRSDMKIKNNHRIRLHLGTAEIIGRVKLFEKDEVSKGEEVFAQLELEKSVTAVPGDLGVLRNYSPMDTIAGIKILNMVGEKVKRYDSDYVKKLKLLLNGDIEEKICEVLKRKRFFTLEEIEKELGREVDAQKLVNSRIFILKNNNSMKYISMKNFDELREKLFLYLEQYHIKNPLRSGVSRSELKNQSFSMLSSKEFGIILEFLQFEEKIETKEDLVFRAGFKIKLNKEQKKIKDEILIKYKGYGFTPPKLSEIEKEFQNRKDFLEVHNYLIYEGFLIELKDEMHMMRGFFKEAQIRLTNYLREHEKISLGDFRDVLETSRKYALILLEVFDEKQITLRKEEHRVLK